MFTTLVLLAQVSLIAPEPPSDREVLRAARFTRGVPYIFEAFCDNVAIVKNRTAEGQATLRLPAGARVTLAVEEWECTMHYTETIESQYPFPFTASRPRVKVVYLDRLTVAE